MVSTAILAATCATQRFEFLGGSGSALAHEIRQSLGLSVVVAEDDGRFTGFKFEFVDNKQFAANIGHSTARNASLLKTGLGLSNKVLPAYRPFEGRIQQLGFANKALLANPETSLVCKDGYVSTGTSGETIELSVLRGLGMSKALDVHWLIAASVVSTSCTRASEGDFLRLVCSAVPGVFGETKAQYTIELDLVRFRASWKERFRTRLARSDLDVVSRAKFEACSAALDALSASRMRDLMSKPRQFAHLSVDPGADSEMAVAFKKFIDLYKRCADLPAISIENIREFEAKMKVREQQFEMVAQNKPWRVTFYNLGRIDLLLPTDMPGSWVAFSVE